jgi:hypothetical protein
VSIKDVAWKQPGAHVESPQTSQPLTNAVAILGNVVSSLIPADPSLHAQTTGGNVLDRPDVEIKRSGWDFDKDQSAGGLQLQTAGDRGSNDRQRSSPPGGGNYRVLLLHSPSHTEQVSAGLPFTAKGALLF